MGIPCSRGEKEGHDHVGQNLKTVPLEKTHSKIVRKHQPHPPGRPADAFHSKRMEAPYDTVAALDAIVDARLRRPETGDVLPQEDPNGKSVLGMMKDVADYDAHRAEFQRREGVLAFDFRCEAKASEREQRANAILQNLRARDKQRFEEAPKRIGYGGQEHSRFPGDRFLSNRALIEEMDLFRVARRLPKGAHLHIHFNACLLPGVLLNIAKDMDRMFILSNIPLAGDPISFRRCEIQFKILSEENEKPGNLFSPDYQKDQTMPFRDFLQQFPQDLLGPVDDYLIGKVVFQEDEAEGVLQTANGAWEKFNAKTRMMKGLFNYERAYRLYTQALLQDFIDDNIQYAEIRPNFMDTNQLWSDDGRQRIDNEGIMEIIMQEYDRFQQKTNGYFGGLKIIYCTPRSFSNQQVQFALYQCFEFKKRWPEWIAGFDLVGEEGKGWPLKKFIPEFLAFRKRCEDANVKIPFLFHCGETQEWGTDTDGNLLDALMTGAKRIGHGFALAAHPYIMAHMKKQNVCLEVCPISNEILGLANRMKGHSMYSLLANDVHCTVNSDNGTMFQ